MHPPNFFNYPRELVMVLALVGNHWIAHAILCSRCGGLCQYQGRKNSAQKSKECISETLHTCF